MIWHVATMLAEPALLSGIVAMPRTARDPVPVPNCIVQERMDAMKFPATAFVRITEIL
ncbi:MAG: hypothetical protein OXC93_13605 [Rhodospirillaceae bacterium]|nr:hypothetical protein [Rhodospirillaceae bacterium]